MYNWLEKTHRSRKSACVGGVEVRTLKKTQQQTDMGFSLKVMGIITFILFCTKKDNKKMRHTISKCKRIVSVFKYIHVHPIDWFFLYLCNYRPLFLHDKWIMAVSVHKANYFRESVRACLFGAKPIHKTNLYSKQLHFPLKCFINYCIDENNLYFNYPLQPPSI